MIYQDSKNFIFDLFQKIQKDAATKISDEEKMQLEAIYKRINFKDFERCNCKNLYQDLVVSLCIFFKQNAAFPKPRRWSMQRGAIISCPVVAAGVATANNLTDEAAEWIKENEPKFYKTFIFENPYYEPDEDSITTDADDSAEETAPKKVGRPKKN